MYVLCTPSKRSLTIIKKKLTRVCILPAQKKRKVEVLTIKEHTGTPFIMEQDHQGSATPAFMLFVPPQQFLSLDFSDICSRIIIFLIFVLELFNRLLLHTDLMMSMNDNLACS